MTRHRAECSQHEIPLILRTAYYEITATVNSFIAETLKDLSNVKERGVPFREVTCSTTLGTRLGCRTFSSCYGTSLSTSTTPHPPSYRFGS
ncbi:hypothetical protein NPIL_461691 [Nephila pilipes]|uniref:Uncharacterized protein n=1 Tax=Nephila pilipes TaxID=299642 RepID=A0A8X6NAV7_NEPPI|nr:hypothetical protein NPIL_461691 [Nephila pilipes]